MNLSIIIPAYNEERRIGETLKAILAYMAQQPYSVEVIVVDDGSQDATAQVVAPFRCEKSQVQLLQNARNRGKGFSVRRGFAQARGDYWSCEGLGILNAASNASRARQLSRSLSA